MGGEEREMHRKGRPAHDFLIFVAGEFVLTQFSRPWWVHLEQWALPHIYCAFMDHRSSIETNSIEQHYGVTLILGVQSRQMQDVGFSLCLCMWSLWLMAQPIRSTAHKEILPVLGPLNAPPTLSCPLLFKSREQDVGGTGILPYLPVYCSIQDGEGPWVAFSKTATLVFQVAGWTIPHLQQ